MEQGRIWTVPGRDAWQQLARVLCAAGPLALALAPTAAQGQTAAKPLGMEPIRVADTDDLDDESSGVGGLPGYPGRGFHLDAQVQTRYDTNLSRRNVADDGLRIRPRAFASYGLGAGRIGLYGVGSYGRDIVRGNQFFRGADRHFYGAGVAAKLSRCNIDAGGSFRQNLLFTAEVALAGGSEQRTTQFGTQIGCQIGSAISLVGGVNRGEIGIVRRVTSAFESERWTYNAGIALNRPGLGRLSLDGSMTNVDFTGRQVLTPNGLQNDGLDQASVRLGFQRDFGSRINLTLGASYLDASPSNLQNVVIVDGVAQLVDRGKFSGLGYDGALVVRLSPRLALTGAASRNVRSNGLAGAQFMVIDMVELGGRYELRDGLTFAAGANFRNLQFRGALVSALEPLRRNRDEFRRYYANLGIGIGRSLKLAFDVSHNQRRSDPSVFNFNSTAVGMTLGFQFGQ